MSIVTIKTTTIAEAILNPYTRAVAVSRLGDIMRERGATYAQIVAKVKALHREAGKPEPTDADVDFWLDDGEDGCPRS